MNTGQKAAALAHLGLRYRRRFSEDGTVDELEVVDAAMPSDADLKAAWDELGQVEAERESEPTAADVLDAIRELAAEGAQVESRINERANVKAQERAGR